MTIMSKIFLEGFSFQKPYTLVFFLESSHSLYFRNVKKLYPDRKKNL